MDIDGSRERTPAHRTPRRSLGLFLLLAFAITWAVLLDLPATSVLFTWPFLRSRGSALPAVLMHAASNAWTAAAVPAGTPAQLGAVAAAKWLLVLGVVAVRGPGLVRPARSPRAPVPT